MPSPNLTVSAADEHLADTHVLRLWAQDLDDETQNAIDIFLTNLAAQNIRPDITVTGDIVAIVTTLSQSLQAMVPGHPATLKTMLDYTTRFLADYMLETGTITMKVHFGSGDNA